MRRSYRQRLLLASSLYLTTMGGVAPVSGEPTPHSQGQQRHAKPQCKANHHHPPFWGISSLPSVPHQQGKTFMDECESLMTVLQRFRGGDSSDFYGNGGGGDYPDDDDYYGNGKNDNNQDYGYDDDYYYDDRGRGSSSSPSSRRSSSSFVDNLPSIFKNGDRRIGLSLVGAGSVITMLGISLFFNKALLRLGNLLFIAGVTITMGISRTMAFFLKPEKLRATACLGLGIFLVFIGNPVFGMILEVFGLLNLFGNMFPVMMAIAKTMPGIGPLLSSNNNKKKNKPSTNNQRRQDDYYDNDDDYYNDNSGGGGGYDDDYYKNNDNYDGGGGYGGGYGGDDDRGYY